MLLATWGCDWGALMSDEKDLLLLKAVQREQGCKKCDVRALIKEGANPASVDPATGLQPIHFAARTGNINVIKALLEDDRVFADAIDPRGKVPYEWAKDFHHTKAEMLLVNTIVDNPKRYSDASIRQARHHLAIRHEMA